MEKKIYDFYFDIDKCDLHSLLQQIIYSLRPLCFPYFSKNRGNQRLYLISFINSSKSGVFIRLYLSPFKGSTNQKKLSQNLLIYSQHDFTYSSVKRRKHGKKTLTTTISTNSITTSRINHLF